MGAVEEKDVDTERSPVGTGIKRGTIYNIYIYIYILYAFLTSSKNQRNTVPFLVCACVCLCTRCMHSHHVQHDHVYIQIHNSYKKVSGEEKGKEKKGRNCHADGKVVVFLCVMSSFSVSITMAHPLHYCCIAFPFS